MGSWDGPGAARSKDGSGHPEAPHLPATEVLQALGKSFLCTLPNSHQKPLLQPKDEGW